MAYVNNTLSRQNPLPDVCNHCLHDVHPTECPNYFSTFEERRMVFCSERCMSYARLYEQKVYSDYLQESNRK